GRGLGKGKATFETQRGDPRVGLGSLETVGPLRGIALLGHVGSGFRCLQTALSGHLSAVALFRSFATCASIDAFGPKPARSHTMSAVPAIPVAFDLQQASITF